MCAKDGAKAWISNYTQQYKMYDVITHPLTHVQIPSMTLSLPENQTLLQKAHFFLSIQNLLCMSMSIL